MADPALLGVPTTDYAAPLRRVLEEAGAAVDADRPALLALKLRERRLAAALLSPVDYARDSSAYRILREAAVSAAGPGGTVRLHVRPGAPAIARLAADPSSAAEIVLARIILAEEFESTPLIVPHPGPLPAMLEEAEAAVTSGQAAIPGLTAIDLVEAWEELTDLPYVYGLWCAYERALPGAEAGRILEAHRRAEAASPGTLFRYQGRDVVDSVRELLHYAFYHGILPDVPEPEFYRPGAGDEPVV